VFWAAGRTQLRIPGIPRFARTNRTAVSRAVTFKSHKHGFPRTPIAASPSLLSAKTFPGNGKRGRLYQLAAGSESWGAAMRGRATRPHADMTSALLI
jgi:hypothetical protein